jgi:clan AA aspartic protease (TIGR02281 family)
MRKIRALLAGALLLVAGTCFADEWPDEYSTGIGPDAKKEFAALPENGRAAYKRALIACAVYVDESTSMNKANCKTAVETFTLEFGQAKFIPLLFNNASIATTQQSREKAAIAALKKIYREGNLHAASVAPTPPIRPAPNTAGQNIIPLQRQGGTFVVPVLINKKIPLNFVVDSGAADVSIPSEVVLTLIRTGTLQDTDFIGTQKYKLADGSIAPAATFRIRSLTVNNVEIGDVKASVAPVAGELLLGQSFLSRFKSWSIDNARQALVLTQ